MLTKNLIAPRLLAWGLVLIVAVTVFAGCNNEKQSWSTQAYSLEYDASVFDVLTEESDYLQLESVTDRGRISVVAMGFYPFDVSQTVQEYLDTAQVSFEEEFDKITNKSWDDNKQFGITFRNVSISGNHPEFEGMTVGMMKVMISDDTLLHVKALGDTKAMNKQMNAVLELIGSAQILLD